MPAVRINDDVETAGYGPHGTEMQMRRAAASGIPRKADRCAIADALPDGDVDVRQMAIDAEKHIAICGDVTQRYDEGLNRATKSRAENRV